MKQCNNCKTFKKADNCIRCKINLESALSSSKNTLEALEGELNKELLDKENMKKDILRLCISGNPGNAIPRIQEYLNG